MWQNRKRTMCMCAAAVGTAAMSVTCALGRACFGTLGG